MNQNRRVFMRHVAVAGAMAGSGLLPRGVFAEEEKQGARVAYRTLGSTGRKVTEIGFGAMNMRDPELVQAAFDAGINYFDTAWYYMNGANEETVGAVLKPVREQVFLTTKVLPKPPAEMRGDIETSLRRLQTDHVDLLLLHSIHTREAVLNEDFMRVLEDAKKSGKAHHIGVSTHGRQVVVMDAAVESKLWEVVLVGYNYMSPPEVKEAIARTRKAGLGIVAMKNLLNPVDIQTWNWEQIPDIRPDRRMAITPAQALIKWVLEDENVDVTIPGMTAFEHVEDDVAVMNMKMNFSHRRALTRYAERVDRDGGYCHGVAGCTGCEDQCPHGVSIREINRCIRYARGYGNPELARENYEQLPSSSRVAVCSSCEECVVKCVHGLNLTATVAVARTLFG